jgi:glycosyltransferase involved in cell wall biosynthesis
MELTDHQCYERIAMKSRPEITQRPQGKSEFTAQENVNQSLNIVRRSSRLFYWNWYYLRPFLKKRLPSQAQDMVQRLRARFQPTIYQHHPIPLKIPKHYHNVTLPFPESLPVVSIVTPSFNQAQFLERTLRSILEQNYPKLEYIIQDGGSTDGTEQVLKRYRSVLRHVESCQDTGQANAINLGFRHTTGDIMAWINADDQLLPGALAYIVKFFLEHPEVDVVYGLRISINHHDQEVGRWILPPHDNTVLPWANYVPQETLFWRRHVWEKAGGYIDESYHFDLDWELLLRFHDVGARFVRLPRFLAAFRVHAAQKTSVLEEIGKQERERLHKQYHGRPVVWLEIRHHVKRYLTRCVWWYLLYYLGLLRY